MRLMFVVAVVTAVIASSGLAASATAPGRQGWWATGATAAGPDVPSDGLLVQGGMSPDSPSAIAALSFQLPSEMVAGKLTLKVAGSTATVPSSVVRVCKVLGAFAPAHGGDMADAPRYDCTDAVTGAIEGDHVTVDVSGLAVSAGLDVALLPSAPTDRVVFAKPDAGALELQMSDVAAPSGGASVPTGPDSATMPTDQPLTLPRFDPVVVPDPLAASMLSTLASSTPASSTPASSTEQVARSAPVGLTTGSSGPSAVLIGLGVLAVALTAALWLGAGGAATRRAELEEAAAGAD